MFDFQTTAFLLEATTQALEETLEGGAALTLIPVAIGTICGIAVCGGLMHIASKKGAEARKNDPNRFKRLK